MLFTFSASGSRAGIGAREFALNSSDHHSHDGLLRHLHHRLPQTGCVIPTVLMRVSSSRTARKQPADEDVIIAVVGRELCTSSLDFARDLGLSEPRVL